MKQIRNTNPVRHLVPEIGIEADPGETCRVPAGAPIPEGWELVEAEKKTTRKPPAATADAKEETD